VNVVTNVTNRKIYKNGLVYDAMTTKEYYRKNKEKVLDGNKGYYLKNKEKVERQKKEYYQKHKDKLQQGMKRNHNSHKLEYQIRDRAWREKNKEILTENKKIYYENNKEKLNERHKEYMKERYNVNDKFNILMRLRGRFGVAWRTYCKTHQLPLSVKSQKYHIDYRPAILHLWKTKPKNTKGWDIEHKMPLSIFDITNEEEVQKAFSPENLQWMEHKDNLKKGKSILSIYLK